VKKSLVQNKGGGEKTITVHVSNTTVSLAIDISFNDQKVENTELESETKTRKERKPMDCVRGLARQTNAGGIIHEDDNTT
jgi:hypothetical protein